MQENENYLKNAELYLEQGGGLIDGVLNNLPQELEPEEKPAEREIEPPRPRRSRGREDR